MNLTLHLSTVCQLRCRYCYSQPAARPLHMSVETALRAVEMAFESGEERCGFVFFGGEPLLRKEVIRAVVERAGRPGAPFSTFKMVTNGLGLDAAFLDYATRARIMVALSIDGGRAAHDRNRVFPDGRGSFEQVDRAAAMLLERQPYAPALMVVGPDTVESYSASVRALVERGFRYVVVSLDHTANWTEATMRALRRQYRALAQAYEAWTQAERKFYFSPFEMKLESHIKGPDHCRENCAFGQQQLSVGPDGRLYPCTQFVGDGTGGVFPLGDVWAGVDEAARSEVVDQAAREAQACQGCALRDRCNHTCGCLNWQTTGSLTQVSPILCANERILTPIVDELGRRLYARRSALFIQKHYNEDYPMLSLIEDRGR